MKKIILGILFFTTFQNVNAQEPIGFSVLVGTNSANFKTNDLKASSGGTGTFIGIGFNMGYHETYNYQLEFAYVQNNINLEDSQLNKKKYGLGGYAQVGLYFNYYIIKPDEGKFYFGPQLGLYTSYGSTTSKDGFSNQDKFEPSGIDGIDLSSVSVFNYGTGIGLTGAFNKLRFNMRYNLGLSNVLGSISKKVEPGAFSEDNPYSGKLSSISLTLSYRIWSKN